jgi:hypothetical protein
VQDGVHDAVTKRLAKTAGTMKVADGSEPGAVIGPLMYMKAAEKDEAHSADALKKGAKVVTGGKRAAQGGAFFEPTDTAIIKEETFGPVAPLYRFKTDAEAIEMANEAPTLTLPRPRGREGHHLGREGVIRYAAADRRLSVHAPKRAAGPCIRLRLPSNEAPELTLDKNIS